ncbi:hypothetical protein O6H91_21G018700 [Diphasiastrum complanatum]|uniref:Uncharacterized protein n=1 Tax=Diphasiastrum complanatum TaxID=34168 RepID=A0ACC2AIE4_DIPCM|nr:hypothetical protein O6H91_21G018700 [Diphasiastrum complanatum]
MAVRLTWGRLGLRSVVSLSEPAMARLFSSGGSGGVLHEEEKAAENIYFKKKDKERLDSIAQKVFFIFS